MLDAGANVGLATVLFAQAIRFNGQVVSVDANPGTMNVGPLRDSINLPEATKLSGVCVSQLRVSTYLHYL